LSTDLKIDTLTLLRPIAPEADGVGATQLQEAKMRVNDLRRQSLEQLLGLAVTYKGLTRKRLAESLGRDPSKLSRETANPKLDYLIRLAELLDWPVGDVAEVIWSEAGTDGAAPEFPTFAAANDAAKAAHRAGDYAGMLHATKRMARLASTPEERATAAHRESGAWDGMGRYTKEVDCGPARPAGVADHVRSSLPAPGQPRQHLLHARLHARGAGDGGGPDRGLRLFCAHNAGGAGGAGVSLTTCTGTRAAAS
jgi:hypothetical protein